MILYKVLEFGISMEILKFIKLEIWSDDYINCTSKVKDLISNHNKNKKKNINLYFHLEKKMMILIGRVRILYLISSLSDI